MYTQSQHNPCPTPRNLRQHFGHRCDLGPALSASLKRLPVDMDWVPSPVGVLMRKDMAQPERLEGLLGILRTVAASARGAMAQR